MRQVKSLPFGLLAIAMTAFMPVSFASTIDYQVPQFQPSPFTLDNQAQAVADKVHIDSGGVVFNRSTSIKGAGDAFIASNPHEATGVIDRIGNTDSFEVASIGGGSSNLTIIL